MIVISGSITDIRIIPTTRDMMITSVGSILESALSVLSATSSSHLLAISSITVSDEPVRKPIASICVCSAEKIPASAIAVPGVIPFLISSLHFAIFCSKALLVTIFSAIFRDSPVSSPADIVIASAEANLALPIALPSPRPYKWFPKNAFTALLTAGILVAMNSATTSPARMPTIRTQELLSPLPNRMIALAVPLILPPSWI